jgi:hypothetical protein
VRTSRSFATRLSLIWKRSGSKRSALGLLPKNRSSEDVSLLSGPPLVFIDTPRDRIKIIFWDRDGTVVRAKPLRLNSVKFWTRPGDGGIDRYPGLNW